MTRRSAHPDVPGAGGSTPIVPSLPDSTAFSVNLPLPAFRIRTSFTAPFSPLASRYLKPSVSALQNGVPVKPLVPMGSR